jgi:hypothetical protein
MPKKSRNIKRFTRRNKKGGDFTGNPLDDPILGEVLQQRVRNFITNNPNANTTLIMEAVEALRVAEHNTREAENEADAARNASSGLRRSTDREIEAENNLTRTYTLLDQARGELNRLVPEEMDEGNIKPEVEDEFNPVDIPNTNIETDCTNNKNDAGEFISDISLDDLVEGGTVKLSDGRCYNYRDIVQWYKTKTDANEEFTSPFNRQPFTENDINIVKTLKQQLNLGGYKKHKKRKTNKRKSKKSSKKSKK